MSTTARLTRAGQSLSGEELLSLKMALSSKVVGRGASGPTGANWKKMGIYTSGPSGKSGN